MKSFYQENVSLGDKTTLKIGGKARFFVRAETESDVFKAVEFAEENRFNFFVLGGGSNVLIADKGFDGLVLQIALKGIETFRQTNKTVLVTAKAGEDWEQFVEFCVKENLAGVECLSGIPGFVGGTPVQNVGAYGQEVSETIVSVKVFDVKTKEILERQNSDCRFSYRKSVFNTTEKNRFIVLAVSFALKQNGEPKIVYKDLREIFSGKKPSLKETREAVLRIREAKSMVINSNDPNSKSAGSFFKNPIVSKEILPEIEKKLESFGETKVPNFSVDEKNVKIPAAWLIEKSGFCKGYRKGSVGLSTKHTLAVVNYENGTANEIIALKNEIQEKVKEKFAVELETEPVFVGFDETP